MTGGYLIGSIEVSKLTNISYPFNLCEVPAKEKAFPTLQNTIKLRGNYTNMDMECFQEGDLVTENLSATTLNPTIHDWDSQA